MRGKCIEHDRFPLHCFLLPVGRGRDRGVRLTCVRADVCFFSLLLVRPTNDKKMMQPTIGRKRTGVSLVKFVGLPGVIYPKLHPPHKIIAMRHWSIKEIRYYGLESAPVCNKVKKKKELVQVKCKPDVPRWDVPFVFVPFFFVVFLSAEGW